MERADPQYRNYRLTVRLPSRQGLLSHNQPALLIGSCFASEVGHQLSERGFPVAVNPFGTLFNPDAIFGLLANPGPEYFEGFNVQREGKWVNHRLHSRLWGFTEGDLRRAILDRVQVVQNYLSQCRLLVITLGTAWVWSLIGDDRSLANLHKQPGNRFDKRLLPPGQVAVGFDTWYQAHKAAFPACQVILTVSPVIHGRAELHENNLSKASLLLACHEIINRHPEVGYFPSFEIVRDELRDYRYFAEDMQHPNLQAVKYVSECFMAAYADDNTARIASNALQQRLRQAHNPGGTASTVLPKPDWSGFLQEHGLHQEAIRLLQELN